MILTKNNHLFTANVNLLYPAEVPVVIVAFGFQEKSFVDSDGNTWQSTELSNLKHP